MDFAPKPKGEPMSDLISRQALCEYALNQKNKSVTPNDIMRFPSSQPEMIREIRKWINSGNRGNADYFIVEKIEEIINKYE